MWAEMSAVSQEGFTIYYDGVPAFEGMLKWCGAAMIWEVLKWTCE